MGVGFARNCGMLYLLFLEAWWRLAGNDGLWMLALDWFMTDYVIKVFFKYF